MLSDSQQIETSSHITLLFVSNLCLHISIFITGKRQNPFACEKAFSGKHVHFVADHRKLLYMCPCGKENRKDASMSSHFIWKKQTTKTLPS